MKALSITAPLLLLACTSCTHNPSLEPDRAAPIGAKVIPVSQTETPGALSFAGVIAARKVAIVSSQVLAPITAIDVHEGDSVRFGEVLVKLSSVPLQDAVEQAQSQSLAAQKQQASAEAHRNVAAQTYARYSILNQRHSVTPEEFDQVKAQLDAANAQAEAAAAQSSAAEAAIRQAQATSGYTVIHSPFRGVVTGKYVDAGSMASPGTPLLRIEDESEHEANIQVNESILRDLHAGERVQVNINGSPAPVAGEVREIVPSGDPAAHTFTVKIGLPPGQRTYSGMTASVSIATAAQPAVTVPKSAIRRNGQLDSVLFLDRNSVAQIRYVTLGREQGDAQEVVSGLSKGDRILADPEDAFIGHRIEPSND